MTLLDRAEALIRTYEPLLTEAAQDCTGGWLIGVGHYGRINVPAHDAKAPPRPFETVAQAVEARASIAPGDPDQTADTPALVITQDEALALFRTTLAQLAEDLEDLLTREARDRLGENQRVALISLMHQLGGEDFARSAVLTLINHGEGEAAADAFRVYSKTLIDGRRTISRNMVRRRKAEQALFRDGLDPELGGVTDLDGVIEAPGLTPQMRKSGKLMSVDDLVARVTGEDAVRESRHPRRRDRRRTRSERLRYRQEKIRARRARRGGEA